MAVQPFELIVGHAHVYLAPVGEAYPATNAAPAGNWVELGYTDGGVSVRLPQSINDIRVDQSMLVKKLVRVSAGVEVEFGLATMTLEAMAKVLNSVTVTDVPAAAGVAGYRHLPLQPTVDVPQYAMLVRGPSPYIDGGNLHWELHCVSQVGEPQTSHTNEGASVLASTWRALESPSAAGTFGKIQAMDALPI